MHSGLVALMFFRIVRFYAKYLALNDRDGMENVLAISVRGYSIVVVLVLLQFPCAFLFMELLVRISKLINHNRLLSKVSFYRDVS